MKYPIGIQDFGKLRREGYVYIDKTEQICRILEAGSYYFLSRPRRFGKSLLLSTIRELYSGSRDLFEGLWAEPNWDWEGKQRPVIWLKFGTFQYKLNPLKDAIVQGLQEEADRLGVHLPTGPLLHPLNELIQAVQKQYGQKVVILIDEYDKPIIDYLDDIPKAEDNRDTLKWLYSVLKDNDPHIELLFVTGVSAFSKVSIFSDLNNLDNLFLHPFAHTLLGITQQELEHYFAEPLAKLDKEQIKRWYNGYSWGGAERVYNPFSLLKFFKGGGQYNNFWFETGTPTFLLKEMKKRRYYDVDRQQASELTLGQFDLENLHPLTVLFQTGYLTLLDGPDRTQLYTLGYPNQEVRAAFQEMLLNTYSEDDLKEGRIRVSRLLNALEAEDMEEVMRVLNATFASLVYDLWEKETEHFFHALVHLTFSLLGVHVQAQVHSARGRCDALVQTDEQIYVFEFKLDQSVEKAMEQIEERGYLTPFQDSPKKKLAVGVTFSAAKRQVAEWKVKVY